MLSRVKIVITNIDLYVEIPGRAIVSSDFPFARQADPIPAVHTCRDLHGQLFGRPPAACTPAVITGHPDCLALPATTWARLLDRKKALLHAYLTRTAASAARFSGSARRGAGTLTFLTGRLPGDFQRHLGPEHGFFQADLKVMLKIGAPVYPL